MFLGAKIKKDTLLLSLQETELKRFAARPIKTVIYRYRFKYADDKKLF